MREKVGEVMKISEVNNAIEDMRKIVPFEDDKTHIIIQVDHLCCVPKIVNLNTVIDDVEISMSKGVSVNESIKCE